MASQSYKGIAFNSTLGVEPGASVPGLIDCPQERQVVLNYKPEFTATNIWDIQSGGALIIAINVDPHEWPDMLAID